MAKCTILLISFFFIYDFIIFYQNKTVALKKLIFALLNPFFLILFQFLIKFVLNLYNKQLNEPTLNCT